MRVPDAHSADQAETTSSTVAQPTSATHVTNPMTTTERREQIIEFSDDTHTRRRIRFVPRRAGDWWRIEEEWTGCLWRHVGRELVTKVTYRQRRPDGSSDT